MAVYLDDVYISQMSGTGFMLFDMERVEILRGPQGTLYGRNATGGLAHFVTRKPSEEFSGYYKITLGEYGQQKHEFAMGGGADNLSARFSYSEHENDGYITNDCPQSAVASEVFGDCNGPQTLNNANDRAWRLQVLAGTGERFSFLLNTRGSTQNIATGFFEHVTTDANQVLQPGTTNTFLMDLGLPSSYTEVDGNSDPYRGSWDRPGFNDLETDGTSITMKWFSDSKTVTSITDRSSVQRSYIEDSDGSPHEVFNFFLNTDATQFSQELRIDGEGEASHWVIGMYYLTLEIDDNNGAVTHVFALFPKSAGGLGQAECGAGESPRGNRCVRKGGIINPYTRDLTSFSAFGQYERQFSDTLSMIFGLRYINDSQEFEYRSFAADFPNFYHRNYLDGVHHVENIVNDRMEIPAYENSIDDAVYAWRLQFDYRPDADSLYYFSANRGVKGGGFNAPIYPYSASGLLYNDDTLTYDPEQLDAFEFGFKKDFMDGASRFNGSLYFYNYTDYQAFEIIGTDTVTFNAEADAWGYEFEYQGSFGGWDVLVGAAYNDIEVVLPQSGATVRSVQSPEVNFNALLRYSWNFPAAGSLAIQLDAVHRSEHFFSLANIDAVREDGYVLANFALVYTSASEKFNARLSAENIGSEEYLVQTFELNAFFGMTEQYYGRPRWISASIRYDF